MQNDMRDRLIDLIRQSHCVDVWDYLNDDFIQPNPIETLADHLIANGVVPMVRCKDCKHWNNGDCYRIELTRPDDYCSYGERK